MIVVSILLFLIILLALVLIHEFGHFVTAKLARVKVEEFAFGFPPRLFSVRRGETEYSFNALPLGGYVKMLGEEDPSDPRSFAARPAWVRLVILVAGSFMNIVLAFALFSAAFMIPTPMVTGGVAVDRVFPGSPAEQAGLQPGDLLLEVAGREVTTVQDLQFAVQLNLGSRTEWVVERDGQRIVAALVPRWAPPPGEGESGIVVTILDPQVVDVSYPVWEAVPKGIQRGFDLFTLTKNGLIAAFSRDQGGAAVTGPVGMFQATEAVAQTGLTNLTNWVAIISLNLGIFNLLPIPMLDGGRVVFVFVEILRRGRRISPERESLVHLAGFVFLLGLIVVVSYMDIVRLLSGENPFR